MFLREFRAQWTSSTELLYRCNSHFSSIFSTFMFRLLHLITSSVTSCFKPFPPTGTWLFFCRKTDFYFLSLLQTQRYCYLHINFKKYGITKVKGLLYPQYVKRFPLLWLPPLPTNSFHLFIILPSTVLSSFNKDTWVPGRFRPLVLGNHYGWSSNYLEEVIPIVGPSSIKYLTYGIISKQPVYVFFCRRSFLTLSLLRSSIRTSIRYESRCNTIFLSLRSTSGCPLVVVIVGQRSSRPQHHSSGTLTL